ncbi:MAG: DNA double-strand break repair nuclease NurA [archaeon GB-1867-005]|nr:DNA double-strand break repair nuclease NurA [Candidatus Culexmicrobium cathedralense]
MWVENVLDAPKVQVQIREKLQLLIDEANRFPELSEVMVDAFRKLSFGNLKLLASEESKLIRRFREIAYPLEFNPKPPPNWSPLRPIDERWADEALSRTLIIGVDTSEITPTPHISPVFLLVNVGYQAVLYGRKSIYLEGSTPFFYASKEIVEEFKGRRRVPAWILEVKRIEDELRVIRDLVGKAPKGEATLALFDESFSMGYLMARSKEFRSKVVSAMLSLHEELKNLNVIPVGVFYTRSRAFTFSVIRSVVCGSKVCSECISSGEELECRRLASIRDLILFDKALELGWRSPLFEVKSQLTSEFSELKVVGFYLKVGASNVFRVEFPSWCADHVDFIHKGVLAQSIIGRGYPYILERAHERAYISSRERAWVLTYIDRLLRSSGEARLSLSGKFRRKLRGVV